MAEIKIGLTIPESTLELLLKADLEGMAYFQLSYLVTLLREGLITYNNYESVYELNDLGKNVVTVYKRTKLWIVTERSKNHLIFKSEPMSYVEATETYNTRLHKKQEILHNHTLTMYLHEG